MAHKFLLHKISSKGKEEKPHQQFFFVPCSISPDVPFYAKNFVTVITLQSKKVFNRHAIINEHINTINVERILSYGKILFGLHVNVICSMIFFERMLLVVFMMLLSKIFLKYAL